MPPDNSDAAPDNRVSLVVDVDDVAMIRVLGVHDRVLGQVEKEFPDLSIHARGNRITIDGQSERAREAMELIGQLIELARTGVDIGSREVSESARIAREADGGVTDVLAHPVLTRQGRTIRPKTLGQKRYVDAVDSHTIVFAIGPAATGKT